ncbi:MAG TPA: ABC transporter permease [Terracidiphilus sp.]
MNRLLHDTRYSLCQLRKSPGFTATAILTLALGIGALTTVATWTNAVLLNPWPQVREAARLRFVSATVLGSNGYSVNYKQFQYMREQGRSFSGSAAFTIGTMNLSTEGSPAEAISTGVVSSGYFSLLGVRPQIGRFFDANASDRAYGQHDELVLSDGLWRERFHADASIVGRTVNVNQHLFTVIGVAPSRFDGIFGGMAEAAWVPLAALRSLSADAPPDPLAHYGLQVVVRLQPGVDAKVAAAELHTLAHNYTSQIEHSDPHGWDLNLDDAAHFQRGLFGLVGEQLPVLAGASLLLLALVCINIASLLGQHAARRRREVAIRTALGAPAARIATQVLVETGILVIAGSLAGWAASLTLSRGLYVLLPNFGMPLAFNLQTDWRTVALVSAVAAVVTLACGMYPVRQALQTSQKETLHAGSLSVVGSGRGRFGRQALLGVQMGMCFVVVVCCSLMTRTALNIVTRPTGFDATNCLTANLALSRAGLDKQRGLAFQSALIARLQHAPGVAGATLTSHLPMGDEGSGNTQDFTVPGYTPAKGEDMEVVTDFEGPDFFRTMRIALRAGREFTSADNADAPLVAMVNRTMAERYWPHGDAIGHSVVMAGKPRQIVGIVSEYTYHSPSDTDATPLLFLPLSQNYTSYVTVAMRSATTAGAVSPQLRAAISALAPSLPLEDVQPLEQVIGQQYQMARIPAELLMVYSLASVIVAMLGLYAVAAYAVVERYREFALRMALGSTRTQIFALVLRANASVAWIGLLTGGLGAFAAVRVLRSMLFGVTTHDIPSFLAAAGVLLLTVIISGLGPARRAATIEPMQALRTE